MDQTEWENLCNHCGKCCAMWNSGFACPLYATKLRRCSDYENRQDRIPECSQITPDNVMQLHEKGVLPADCNYVLHHEGKELIEKPDYVVLKPFTSAPMKFQMHYWRNRGKL